MSLLTADRGARLWVVAHRLAAPLLALAVHAPSLGVAFYTHDCWNALEVGERVLSGTLGSWENLQRLLVVWSFGGRAALGLDPWLWHVPNWLLHAVNAALVRTLAARLGGTAAASTAAGASFAVAPLLAHPVEWLGGGYDLVATFGVLGTTLAAPRHAVLAALACAVGLLGKETGVLAVPVALLLWRRLGAGRGWLRSLLVPTLLTVAVLVGRWVQVRYGPGDGLAGRSVGASFGEVLQAAPRGLGMATIAPFAEWLGDGWAWAGCALAGLAAWRARVPELLAAALLAVAPVLAIGITADELLSNTRYLYLSTALLAPLLPLALARSAEGERDVVRPVVLAVGVAVASWNGVDRVLEGARLTRATSPVLEAVLALPRGSAVTVLSGFYDEPTARFLMSRWLALNRGIRARYVMRGTGIMYVRRGGGRGDAALSYFAEAPRRFEPRLIGEGEKVLLQDVGAAKVEWVELPASRPTETRSATLSAPWTLLSDSESAVVQEATLSTAREVGPVGSATLEPMAELAAIGEPLATTLRLQLVAKSTARARYAAGYHDRWTGLFFGPPPYDTRRAVSVPVRADGSVETLTIELWWDPVLWRGVDGPVGVLPLNYPGELTLLPAEQRVH